MQNVVAVLVAMVASMVAMVSCNYGDKVTSCYYRNWSQYGRGKAKFLPEHINPKLCNVIKYAFLRVNIDTFELETYQKNDIEMLGKINALKKKTPDFKVVIAVGGWKHEYLPRFAKMTETRERRQIFIKSLIRFLKEHNLDGVSYSWIYPGTRSSGSPEEERNKFSVLIKETSEAFEAESSETSKRFLLTAAVSPYVRQIKISYDVAAIRDYIDNVDVITNSLWTHKKRRTGSSTAMKGKSQTIIDSVENWIKSGMPASKINIGFSLYGHTFKLADVDDFGLGARTIGPGAATALTRTKGILGYYEICSRVWEHKTAWYKSKTKTGYASDKQGVWVSFDNPKSLKYKLFYLLRKYNLHGVTLWSLDFDDFTGEFCKAGKFPLLRQVACTMEAVQSLLPPITCRSSINLGFLMDSSASLTWDFSKVKRFIKVIAASFGVSFDGTHAGVISFSDDAENTISFDDNFDIYSFNSHLGGVPLLGGETRIDKGLRLAQQTMFSEDNGMVEGLPNVLVVVTDGSQTQADGAEDPTSVANELRSRGIKVITVGVGKRVNPEELNNIAGGEDNTVIADTFGELLGSEVVNKVNAKACPDN